MFLFSTLGTMTRLSSLGGKLVLWINGFILSEYLEIHWAQYANKSAICCCSLPFRASGEIQDILHGQDLASNNL